MGVAAAAAEAIIPTARWLSRYCLPVRAGLWRGFIEPKLAWRNHPFTAETAFGAHMAGTTADVIQCYIYYFGLWEPHVGGLLQRRLKPGDVVIDVGANIGYMTLLAASLVGRTGRVISIEAADATFQKLKANVERNAFGWVRVIHGAVTSEPGTVKLFHSPESNTGMTSIMKDFGHGAEEVRGGPLDLWVSDDDLRRVRLIKIDVEGAEIGVLEGIARLLDKLPNSVELICEISPSLSDGGQLLRLMDQFQAAGFRFFELPHDTMEGYFHPVTSRAKPLSGPITRRTELVISRSTAGEL
jgi:FkbM family methyltransferase